MSILNFHGSYMGRIDANKSEDVVSTVSSVKFLIDSSWLCSSGTR